MAHLNLPPSKRNPRQWKLLDIISALFFALVLLFFLLLFTPLGDSMAASGRQALLLSSSDPKQRHRLVALLESGHHHQPIEACPADSVDHMPCEDPRRNSQLSREMIFYRERHCPPPDELPLCLIPPPYKISVQWPESLHKWPKQDKEWADLQSVARALCYELIAVDGNTVIWKKPDGDSCLPSQNELGIELCDVSPIYVQAPFPISHF